MAGGFPTPNPTTRALFALRQMQTFEDKKRGTLDAMRYAASVGVTTQLDQGAFPATGNAADGAAHVDGYRAYDALLALYAEGELINRIRINFLHMETDPDDAAAAGAARQCVSELWRRHAAAPCGIGEFTAGDAPIIGEASRKVAQRHAARGAGRLAQREPLADAGRLQGHHRRLAEVQRGIARAGITKLRWVVAHVPFITASTPTSSRRSAAGSACSAAGATSAGTAQQNGPPFRMLQDSGIPMGMSSDGMQISPMNPWLGLYYVVTGKNARGELINAARRSTATRRAPLYTAGKRLVPQRGRHARHAGARQVRRPRRAEWRLLRSKAVPDEAIKRIHSMLTLVDGKIVHG